jgi:3-phosphoshikimate 1-carboxyvinyltransferase
MEINADNSSFTYEGVIPASKSAFNRALVIQSYEPKISVIGEGLCDDIAKMRTGLINLRRQEATLDCGEGGTVLRFLALRASRQAGSFLLTGKPRLFKRPQNELLQIFAQLQVRYQMEERGLRIDGRGWKIPSNPIRVNARESSQFLSGLLLNCWELSQEVKIVIGTDITSGAYFQLTQKMLQEFGMTWHQEGNVFVVPPMQRPKICTYQIESDVSSAFAVAALAVVAGKALIKQFPFESSQPDLEFLKIFKAMGVRYERRGDDLWVEKSTRLNPVQVNLSQCPDLFPVLSALCICPKGVSKLFGAPQLKYKESDRINEVVTLLQRLGVPVEAHNDGAILHPMTAVNINEVLLDAKDDHRLVMMGVVLKAIGFNIKIINSESIKKSFPEFVDVAKGFL